MKKQTNRNCRFCKVKEGQLHKETCKKDKIRILITVSLAIIVICVLLFLFNLARGYHEVNKFETGPSMIRVFNAFSGTKVANYLADKNTSLELEYDEEKNIMFYKDNETSLIIDARTYEVKEDKVFTKN